LSPALDGDTGVLSAVGRPAPHLSLVRTPPPAVAAEPVSAPVQVQAPEDARPARRVRVLRRPPRRRAPLLLAALALGGVLAWLPGGPGPSTSPEARDHGYDVASDAGLSGSLDDVDARQGITAAEARRRLDDLAASRAARTPLTVVPTQGHLSTCFCMRWGQFHEGIDLAAPLGTPIVAATDGVVLRAGPASGFGNAVWIQDTDGNVEVYGHMRYYDVHAGDVVRAGDPIAKVGSEGQSTGPHLHFEIRQGSTSGRRIDPQQWLADRGVAVTG
jgi:murein DD-endopeptidase MepM/ murein hydrolase activator NlpD